MISAVANDLFYGNQLIDGVLVDRRMPLLDELPTLGLIDVSGNDAQDGTGSYYNASEVSICQKLLLVMVGRKLAPQDIGVIALCTSCAGLQA